MSRLTSLSPAALKAIFSPDSEDTLHCLLTITGSNLTETIRLSDGYSQRISETDDDIVYGVVSRGNPYIFLPIEISLPTEEDSAPRASLTLHDVTRTLLPQVRGLTTAPSIKIELVLSSNPDNVEVDLGDFYLSNIQYNQDTISGDLVLDSYEIEPFPSGTFTPNYFPGLF